MKLALSLSAGLLALGAAVAVVPSATAAPSAAGCATVVKWSHAANGSVATVRNRCSRTILVRARPYAGAGFKSQCHRIAPRGTARLAGPLLRKRSWYPGAC